MPVKAHVQPSVKNNFFCFTGAEPPGDVPPPFLKKEKTENKRIHMCNIKLWIDYEFMHALI